VLAPFRSGKIHIYFSDEDMQPVVIYILFLINFVSGGTWTARSTYIFIRKCLNTVLL